MRPGGLAEAPTLVPGHAPGEGPTLVPRHGREVGALARGGRSAGPVALAVGQVLAGRFVLERRLGAGGLAEVWAARDLKLGADVAIKALHAHLASDAALCERFRRELAVTRELDHPGVVKVYDFYSDGGRPFFALELLRGKSLAERLAEGPVERAEALRIAREAAVALQVAHRRGVVHRDLKPHNLFLAEDPQGGAPRVVLLDFGLARAAGLSRMTATSTVLGTPGYIAPEVLSGTGCDGRADLYALGAVLFELLTGKRAFASVDPQAVLAQKGAPPRLEDALPGASEADAALVARLLEPDPERRFLDAGQVLRALGGGAVAAAPEAPPALTAGGHDVLVRRGMGLGLSAGRALERVRRRLGIDKPALGWRARLWLSGENKLVAGASQASAERVAALCREEGLGAQVVPAKSQGLLGWLAARALPLGLALAAVNAAQVVGLQVGYICDQLHWLARARERQDFEENRGYLEASVATWERIHGSALEFARWTLESLQPDWLLRSTLPTLLALGGLGFAVQRLAAPAPVGSAPGEMRRTGVLPALLAGVAVALFVRLQQTLPAPWLIDETVALFNPLTMPGHPWYEVLLPTTLRALNEGLFYRMGRPVPWWVVAGPFVASCAAIAGALRKQVPTPPPLPSGDPVVRRLAAGIERRLASLRSWARRAPHAEQGVALGLLSAAEEVARPVPALAEAAAHLEDQQGRAPSDPALEEREAALAQQREVAVESLLQIAAGLDDALAALEAPGQGAARRDASAPLQRLREELAARAAAEPEPAGSTPVDPQRARVRA